LTTLENLKSLKKFKLQLKRYLSRSITDPKLKKFCTHLKELESLQTLDLNFAESSISNIGITSFAASLKQLPLLHTINLDFSAGILITPEWIKSLINSLDKLQNLRCLGLDLECCDTALAQLSKGLINFTNLITFKLRLIGNTFTSNRGFAGLAFSLSKMESLKELYLTFEACDQITPKGILEVSNAIEKFTFLQKISFCLRNCQQVDGTSLLDILESLASIKTLQSVALDFSSCNVTNDDLTDLHLVFKKLHFLQKLNLSLGYSSKITDPGLRDLAKALLHLVSLQSFQLSYKCAYQITQETVLILKNALSSLQSLKNIYLQEATDDFHSMTNHRVDILEEIKKSLPYKQVSYVSRFWP